MLWGNSSRKRSSTSHQITCAAMFYPWTECALWLSSWVLRCWNSCRPPLGSCRWSPVDTGKEGGPSPACLGPCPVGCWGNRGWDRRAAGPVESPWTRGLCAWVWHWRWAKSATGPAAWGWQLDQRWGASGADWRIAWRSRGASWWCCPSFLDVSTWPFGSGTKPNGIKYNMSPS